MANITCDECHVVIGQSNSVIYLDPKIMNEHNAKVHGGNGFEYGVWKD